MPFKKGESGNPQGKPKGAVNKTTKEIREAIGNIIGCNIETLQKDIDSLEPRDRAKFIIDLLPFAIPKMQAIATKDFTEDRKDKPIDLSKVSDECLKELLAAAGIED